MNYLSTIKIINIIKIIIKKTKKKNNNKNLKINFFK